MEPYYPEPNATEKDDLCRQQLTDKIQAGFRSLAQSDNANQNGINGDSTEDFKIWVRQKFGKLRNQVDEEKLMTHLGQKTRSWLASFLDGGKQEAEKRDPFGNLIPNEEKEKGEETQNLLSSLFNFASSLLRSATDRSSTP